MPERVLKDATLAIAGTDLTVRCTQLTITYESESEDDTNFGDQTVKTLPGLMRSWSVSATVSQDYEPGFVDEVLFAHVGAAVTFAAKPTSAPASVSNPRYTGIGVLMGHQPISGSPGALATTDMTLEPAGELQRETS